MFCQNRNELHFFDRIDKASTKYNLSLKKTVTLALVCSGDASEIWVQTWAVYFRTDRGISQTVNFSNRFYLDPWFQTYDMKISNFSSVHSSKVSPIPLNLKRTVP